MQYFVLCFDEKQRTIFVIIFAKEAFPKCETSTERMIAVHSFANTTKHPKFSLFASSEKPVLEGIRTIEVNSLVDFMLLKADLLGGGWLLGNPGEDMAVVAGIEPTRYEHLDWGDNEDARPKESAYRERWEAFLIRLQALKNLRFM